MAGTNQVSFVEIEGEKRRAAISPPLYPFLEAVQKIVRAYRPHWPLSVRQIHYALLNNPPLTHASKPDSTYRNVQSCYKQLCKLLVRARLENHVPMEAIDDMTRPIVLSSGFTTVESFIQQEVEGFLEGFQRNLQQSQKDHIEILAEKNTLFNIVAPVAEEYRIPLTVGRGYCSLPPCNAMARRFRQSRKRTLILLVLSDLDPDGEEILQSFARMMRDDFGVWNIQPLKVALTAEQVDAKNLPASMDAKATSTRCAGFVNKYGWDAYELESLGPDDLQALLREAVESVMDMDAFDAEVEKEEQEQARLEETRDKVLEMLGEVL